MGHPKGVISPLLALLSMRRFLLAWHRWEGRVQAFVCAHADDFVILCRGTAAQVLTVTRDLMRRLTRELNEEKTRIVHAREDSFDFLGYTCGRCTARRVGPALWGQRSRDSRARRPLTLIQNLSEGNGWPC